MVHGEGLMENGELRMENEPLSQQADSSPKQGSS